MRQEFLPNIYSHPWYNGRQEKDVYVENKVSLLVGMPWMRQLRVKKSKLYDLEFANLILNRQKILCLLPYSS